MQGFSQVQYPSSLNEFFNNWENMPGAQIYTNGSYLMQKQTGRLFNLPGSLLSVENIPELHRLSRTERFLEIGSLVKLNRILAMGKIIPSALRLAIRCTSTYLLRNTTALGSCIAKDLNDEFNAPEPVVASLVALKARYELHSAKGARFVSSSQFINMEEEERKKTLGSECITKIFIPLENWDYTLCDDFNSKYDRDNGREFAVFLVRIQNKMLKDIRVAFCGGGILSNRKIEESIINNKLPLEKKIIQSFIKLWDDYLDKFSLRSSFQNAKWINFLESALYVYAH